MQETMKEELKELIIKLGQIDTELKQLKSREQALQTEYNNIMLELWNMIPPVEDKGKKL